MSRRRMSPEQVSAIRSAAGRKGAAARWGRRGSLPSNGGSDLPERHLKMARPVGQLKEGRSDWYRIDNKAGQVAKVYIYDEIGWFGVTADDFVKDLNAVTAGEIELHLNSPGGDAFQGIAIYNALRNHQAKITVRVDGLAASAASFIAQAGERVVIEKTAQMMIHDAAGLVIGNASDMREMADLLDKMSDNIASIYADRSGGGLGMWRDRMRAESWYSADEAVKAGLADEVAGGDESRQAPDNKWDLSIFNYAGREHAPAPVLVNVAADPPAEPALTPEVEPGPALAEPFAFDPDLFKLLVGTAAENVPAPPDIEPTPPEPAPFQFDPERFRRSVMEALT